MLYLKKLPIIKTNLNQWHILLPTLADNTARTLLDKFNPPYFNTLIAFEHWHGKEVFMKLGLLSKMLLSILTPAIAGLLLVAGVS